ncbi:ribosomal RNA processing protein 36 homolog [Mustelus asterias]
MGRTNPPVRRPVRKKVSERGERSAETVCSSMEVAERLQPVAGRDDGEELEDPCGQAEASGEDHESESTGSEDSDSDSSAADGQTAHSIQKELSTLSFEQLQELQSKVGLKVYNQVAFGAGNGDSRKKRNRPQKNRPLEMSASRPVPFLRKVVPVRKELMRDPRFDDLSGEFDPDIYNKTYSFLSEIRDKEKEVIRKKLRKAKDPRQKQKLECLLQRMIHRDEAQKKQRQQKERLKEFKQNQRTRVQQGSKPYFLKKSEQRKLELKEKYLELKRSGKVETFLAKKRKRNAIKDRRKLPGKKSL